MTKYNMYITNNTYMKSVPITYIMLIIHQIQKNLFKIKFFQAVKILVPMELTRKNV